MTFGSLPKLGKIAERKVDIVENVGHKALGDGARDGGGDSVAGKVAGIVFGFLAGLRRETAGLFDIELGDDLRLSFVEDLKIFFAKIADGMSLGVANYGANDY
jgi:hypothetical protein